MHSADPVELRPWQFIPWRCMKGLLADTIIIIIIMIIIKVPLKRIFLLSYSKEISK